MRLLYLICLLSFSAASTIAQVSFVPPTASAAAVQGVPFSSAQSVGNQFRQRFKECESHNTCDGVKQKFGCSLDPSRNTALLRLPNGTIFFDGKMGLDADGSPIAKKNATGTDQPETSFRFSVPGSPSVDADKIPFIVLPGGGFGSTLGLQMGDVAAVVFNGKVVLRSLPTRVPSAKSVEGRFNSMKRSVIPFVEPAMHKANVRSSRMLESNHRFFISYFPIQRLLV